MEKKFITENEAAAILNRETQTLRVWRVKGIGPPYVKDPQGAIHYEKEALETWVYSGQAEKKEGTENG